MKKGTIVHAALSFHLSTLGHTDELCIADAGLPIPKNTPYVDLALCKNTPSFLQVFDAILSEVCIEGIVLAQEIKDHNPRLHEGILMRIENTKTHQGKEIGIEYISHEAFKTRTETSKILVRSGEMSPYANILFKSGVAF